MKPILIIVVGALAALPLAGCSSAAVANRMVSTESEILLGDKAAPEFERMLGGKVADPVLQAYVQHVGQKIAAVAPRRMPYEFYVLESTIPNAFSLPGGRTYVTSGLVAILQTERELAALLANQVAHTCRRDPVKVLFDGMGGEMLVAIARLATEDEDETGYVVAERVAAEVIRGQHTRKEEILSDELAMSMMAKAGYNPWGMPELLANLHNRHRLEPTSVHLMLTTHPLTDKRFKLAKLTAEVDYFYFKQNSPDPATTGTYADARNRLSGYRSRIGRPGVDPRLITFQND